jgi:hypothetical protein
MASVQTAAQFKVIANSIGIPDERATSIKALIDSQNILSGDAARVSKVAAICNSIGYYNEYADRLVAAGLTFTAS